MEKKKHKRKLITPINTSTFAIRNNQRTDQKLQKSLLCKHSQNCLKKFCNASINKKKHRHTADNNIGTQYLQGIQEHGGQKADR